MKKFLFILLVLAPLLGFSQNFEYQVRFEGIGDNREYFSNMALPQTILGSRGAFELGVESEGHRMRGGLSHLIEFGADLDYHKPKLTLYYQFSDEKKEFLFGAFPRRNKIDFPLVMLTDTLLYYRPNIEGLYGKVNWDWGHQLGFVDWVSRQTDTKRENFLAGFSGEISHKELFLQNHLIMFHDAGNGLGTGRGLTDYLAYAVQAGVRIQDKSEITASFKIGVLGSSVRVRAETNDFVSSTSLFAETKARFKNFGVKSVLHSGQGHNFALGDKFYRAKNYWRTDVLWYFINHEKVKGQFNLSFHLIDWNDLDQQQQLSIVYLFGK